MSHPLPAVPSLDQLRNQAKDLLAAWQGGDPVALARLAQHHPRYRRGSEGEARRSPQLADAQLVLAREYGLFSWPKLREEVRLRMLSFDARAARFVRMAAHSNPGAKNQCWAIANAMLDREPALAKASVYTALALGDVAAVRERLRSDPGWPVTASGPGTARQPLLWASFSRLHRRDPAIASGLLESARLLLDHGADVNAGYSAEETGGSVLRPLYGACGAADFPEMAALLIERGAMVDDGESLYHSVESDNTRCLELLLARGADPRLGNTLAHALDVEGIPRLELLLAAGANPNATLEGQPVLHRAIALGRGLKAIELLLAHGADPLAIGPDGQTAIQVARTHGEALIANRLVQAGADDRAGAFEQFVDACAKGAVGPAREIAAATALFEKLAKSAIEAYLQLASRPESGITQAMLAAGFPVDAANSLGQRALHWAAWNGRAPMVQALLDRGAAIEARENEFGGTPLGWAVHGSQNARPDGGDYLATVKALLAAGADPNGKNAWGEAMINELDESEVADLLRAAGCQEDSAP